MPSFFDPPWRQGIPEYLQGYPQQNQAWLQSFAPAPGAFGPGGNPAPPPVSPLIDVTQPPPPFQPPRTFMDSGDQGGQAGAEGPGVAGNQGPVSKGVTFGNLPGNPIEGIAAGLMGALPGGFAPMGLNTLGSMLDPHGFNTFSGTLGYAGPHPTPADTEAANRATEKAIRDSVIGQDPTQDPAGVGMSAAAAQSVADAMNAAGFDAGRPGGGDNAGSGAGPGSSDAGGSAAAGEGTGQDGEGRFKGGKIRKSDLTGPDPAGPDTGYLKPAVKADEFILRDEAVRQLTVRGTDLLNRSPAARNIARKALEKAGMLQANHRRQVKRR